MDISKSISYRGLEVNGVALQSGTVLRGISIEQADYSDVTVDAYVEKRAGTDGMHASDVFLGARQVSLNGHIYATSVAELFDYLHVVRSVFSPTSAYGDDPGSGGFLPLHFQQSTLDLASFSGGIVPLFMNLRPRVPPRFQIIRDRQNSSANWYARPTSTPWSAQLWAKDPRVYVDPAQSLDMTAGPPALWQVQNAINRGDYESPLNIILVIGSTQPPAGAKFQVKGLNNIDMTITIEQKANTVYRWMGNDRVLLVEDVAQSTLILRMDLVSFATSNHKPMVPASINPSSRPFSTPVNWYRSGNILQPGSRLFWNEAFA